MTTNKLIILYASIGLLIACSSDDSNVSFDDNSFVYVETINFDDYTGDSKLLIKNGGNTSTIHTSNERIEYQISNSKIFYKDGYDIVEYDPSTNQSNIIASTTDTQIHSFSISPTQKYLVFSDYYDIILLDLEDETRENLTLNLEGDFRLPKWSPNGTSILIRNNIPIVSPGDSYPTATGNFKIYSLSNESFQDVEMLDLFASPGKAEWSPDGEMIMYKQYQGVFIFNINSQQLRRITSEEIVATNPKFSTNGKFISYFSSDMSDNGNNWQNFLTISNFESGTSTIVNNSYSYDVSWKDDSKLLFCTGSGIFSYNLNNETITNQVNSQRSIYLNSVNYLK